MMRLGKPKVLEAIQVKYRLMRQLLLIPFKESFTRRSQVLVIRKETVNVNFELY